LTMSAIAGPSSIMGARSRYPGGSCMASMLDEDAHSHIIRFPPLMFTVVVCPL
jgi:hypothetical protein